MLIYNYSLSCWGYKIGHVRERSHSWTVWCMNSVHRFFVPGAEKIMVKTRKNCPGKNRISWVLDGKKRKNLGKNRFWTGFFRRPGKKYPFSIQNANTVYEPIIWSAAKKSHCHSKVFVCVTNNYVDAVVRLLISCWILALHAYLRHLFLVHVWPNWYG